MPAKTKGKRLNSRVRSKKRSTRYNQEIENLVRAGVERFMFKDATIDDFLKTIRAASSKEGSFPHPLTRAVFSRIVSEATKKYKKQNRDK